MLAHIEKKEKDNLPNIDQNRPISNTFHNHHIHITACSTSTDLHMTTRHTLLIANTVQIIPLGVEVCCVLTKESSSVIGLTSDPIELETMGVYVG